MDRYLLAAQGLLTPAGMDYRLTPQGRRRLLVSRTVLSRLPLEDARDGDRGQGGQPDSPPVV